MTLATFILADVNLSLTTVLWWLVVGLIAGFLASRVILFLLLCLWSIGGGLVSLFGTWVAAVRHPHYMRLGE